MYKAPGRGRLSPERVGARPDAVREPEAMSHGPAEQLRHTPRHDHQEHRQAQETQTQQRRGSFG